VGRSEILKDYSPIAAPSVNKSLSENRSVECARITSKKMWITELFLRAIINNKAAIVR